MRTSGQTTQQTTHIETFVPLDLTDYTKNNANGNTRSMKPTFYKKIFTRLKEEKNFTTENISVEKGIRRCGG